MTTTLINTEINRIGKEPILISLSLEKEGYCIVRVHTSSPEKFNAQVTKEAYGANETETIRNGYKVYASLVKKFTFDNFELVY